MTQNRLSMRAAMRRMLPALALAGVAACQDVTDLDESAATFISPDQFYRTDAQVNQAVNGIYAPLMGWNGWKQPAQHSMMCDDHEMLCWNWMGGGFAGRSQGEWYNQDNSTYFGDYQMIERANEVMENVGASGTVSATVKKTAVGQALFARGYAYFDLVRRWGGVPVRLQAYKPDVQMGALARSPVDSVYKVIVRDLRLAADSLPVSYSQPNGQGLPRRASAWGLLAKVYMHMAGDQATGTPLEASRATYLDSARIAAQMVMADEPASVALEGEYMDLFDINKQNTSKEILFAVQGSTVNLGGSNIPTFTSPRGDCTLVGGCGTGFLSIREDFYNSFAKTDKRIEPGKAVARSWEYTNSPLGKIRVLAVDSVNALWSAGRLTQDKQFRWESWTEGCGAFGITFDSLFMKDPATGATSVQVVGTSRPRYSLKYIDPTHLGSEYAPANNFIILRYADVLLLFAEAENEKNGPTQAAYDAINRVRNRAKLGNLTPGLGKDQFRQAVWQERSWELYGEFQAKFDLIREGRWLDVMNQKSTVPDFAGHQVGGQNVCRPRQTYQKLQAVPSRELAANPLMTQNPGY